ncbi:hypothetical protein BJV77DRAFT_1064847 [Russula vinacea]|nr:hypothetical protein BJV77DRAFT_1064847 [Russula vinacea]
MSQRSTPATVSPLSRSFLDASTAVDDLTRSLADYSRVSTPEPPPHLPGCECNTEHSEYTRAWLAVKAKLESRLVLSAEVGQALLQRHEAYVRRMQATERADKRAKLDNDPSDPAIDPANRRQLEDRIAELSRENAVLEKRFTQALLNNELAEVSNKTLSTDLEELRVAFNRVTAEHARAVGWEVRLREALQERDDFLQERDSEAQKLRGAEARLTSLSDKCAKLGLEVRVLEERLEEERAKRGQATEEMMHETKQWLAGLQHSRVDLTSIEHHDEIMKLLESLVADKEALRKSNMELQELLSQAREALQVLQEEAGERLVSSPEGSRMSSPIRSARHRDVPASSMVYGTAPGPFLLSQLSSRRMKTPDGQAPSQLRVNIPSEIRTLDPETSRRPLSPSSYRPSRVRRRRERDSDIDIELEAGCTTNESDADDPTPGKQRRKKPLYSMQRHRAVQTDFRVWAGSLSPAGYGDQLCLPVSSNGESESSSLVDNPSTLGADVGYLSHSTVDGIIAEVANLRVVFRAALEDDKFTTICTRHDLRSLLRFLKDIFRELGTLRTSLNDIVLDPSIAPKRMDGPLSKFFGSATSGDSKREVTLLAPTEGRVGPSRSIPKLGPATSASATTVNVEFTGIGAGRAVTNVSAVAQDAVQDAVAAPAVARSTSVNLMGIFAGAPRNDSWVVLPPGSSRQKGERADQLRRTTLGRAAGRIMARADTNTPSALPRNIDAIIDFDPHALQRNVVGLTPHHGEAVPVTQPLGPPEVTGGQTVMGALSQTLLGVRSAVPGKASTQSAASPPSPAKDISSSNRAASPRLTALIPDVSSWAAASRTLNAPDPDTYVGSFVSGAPPAMDRRGEL